VIIVTGGFELGRLITFRPFWAEKICQIDTNMKVIPIPKRITFFFFIFPALLLQNKSYRVG